MTDIAQSMAHLEHERFKQLKKDGWTSVLLDPWKVKSIRQLCNWCDCYCPDEYSTYGNYFIFKDERQALWFKLRWL